MMAMIRIDHLVGTRGHAWTVEEIQPDGDGGALGQFDTRAQAIRFAIAYAGRTGATLLTAEIVTLTMGVA